MQHKIYMCSTQKYVFSTKINIYAPTNTYMLEKIYVCKKEIFVCKFSDKKKTKIVNNSKCLLLRSLC